MKELSEVLAEAIAEARETGDAQHQIAEALRAVEGLLGTIQINRTASLRLSADNAILAYEKFGESWALTLRKEPGAPAQRLMDAPPEKLVAVALVLPEFIRGLARRTRDAHKQARQALDAVREVRDTLASVVLSAEDDKKEGTKKEPEGLLVWWGFRQNPTGGHVLVQAPTYIEANKLAEALGLF